MLARRRWSTSGPTSGPRRGSRRAFRPSPRNSAGGRPSVRRSRCDPTRLPATSLRRSGAHCSGVCTVAHESIESLASDDEKILQTQQAARFSAAPELAHPPLDSAGSSGELYAGGPPLGRDSPRAPPLPAPLQAPLAADSHRLSRDPHRAAPERPRPRAYVSSKRLLGLGVAARETAKKISDGIVARRAARVARRPAVRSATVVTGRLPSLLGHMQAARPVTPKRKQVAPHQAASGTRTRTSMEVESGRISSMGSS